MPNMLSPFKRKVSLALNIETIYKLDQKAETDKSTRNLVAEYVIASMLEYIELTPENAKRVQDEIAENKAKRRGK